MISVVMWRISATVFLVPCPFRQACDKGRITPKRKMTRVGVYDLSRNFLGLESLHRTKECECRILKGRSEMSAHVFLFHSTADKFAVRSYEQCPGMSSFPPRHWDYTEPIQ
jgi:hypothetical protein